MGRPFDGKRVLLGVSGSIAVYKAVDLASKLSQEGALVDVLMTSAAMEFVAPITFRSVTHRAVVTDLFDTNSHEAVEHVALAKAADILVVAPATANTLYKLAHGQADDPVSVTALATTAPLLIAPAMDGNMWHHSAVQANVALLERRGAVFAGPASGHLASGLEGWGRLMETPELLGRIAQVLGKHGDLAGKTIVVSAGGTEEAIDPVRVISNRSSGKMGYAIAVAARDRGARVTLVAAPGALPDPVGMDVIHVASAAEMGRAVLAACEVADALIMAAAVADFRLAEPSAHKIKRRDIERLSLDLIPNEDFFNAVPDGVMRIGFSAESDDMLANARQTLDSKHLDLVAANDITRTDAGFEVDTNQLTLLDRDGGVDELELMSKRDAAWALLDRATALLAEGKRGSCRA